LFFAITLISFFGLNAAAPLTHLYLTDAISASNKFLRGSTFPDIRYFAQIPREQTHKKDVLYGDILLEENFFERGYLFHSFVDVEREKIIEKHRIYELLSFVPKEARATLLKLAEDELIFDRCDTEKFKKIFSEPVYKEELNTGIPKETIIKWNNFMNSYVCQKPSSFLLELAKKNQNFFKVPASKLTAASKIILQLASNAQIKKYFEELISYFVGLCEKVESISKKLTLEKELEYKKIKRIEIGGCYIFWLETSNGKKFVAKQIKDRKPDEQFLLVADASAHAIAQEMGFPCNRVKITLDRRILKKFPVTLHTIAPGASAEESPPWPYFNMHQRLRKEGVISKWGPLPKSEAGLTQNVVKTMSKNNDLIMIAALDTFTCNGDRSTPNIFYDRKTNKFCGIDMAAAFNKKLARAAINQINSFRELDENEIVALKKYLDLLKELSIKFTPNMVSGIIANAMKAGGFTTKPYLRDVTVYQRYRYNMRLFKENYFDVLELTKKYCCDVLEGEIKNQAENKKP
jgi:hypothetical protein